jgi:hypothetical protein
MRRIFPGLAVAALAALLAGCNETTGPVASVPPPATRGPAASAVSASNLPPGAACTSEFNEYQAVLRADVETGNVNKSVFDQIQRELTGANAACAAGRDAEARSLIQASKARHGYRA